jgi:hypothetical protein
MNLEKMARNMVTAFTVTSSRREQKKEEQHSRSEPPHEECRLASGAPRHRHRGHHQHRQEDERVLG